MWIIISRVLTLWDGNYIKLAFILSQHMADTYSLAFMCSCYFEMQTKDLNSIYSSGRMAPFNLPGLKNTHTPAWCLCLDYIKHYGRRCCRMKQQVFACRVTTNIGYAKRSWERPVIWPSVSLTAHSSLQMR